MARAVDRAWNRWHGFLTDFGVKALFPGGGFLAKAGGVRLCGGVVCTRASVSALAAGARKFAR